MQIWETPSHYFGYDPIGHILVLTTHRDADALTRTNWDAARQRLAKAACIDTIAPLEGTGGAWETPSPDVAPAVYTWSAGSSLIGWIDYLMVRPDAPQPALDEAQAIADDLAAYPSLDETAWSELEYEETSALWASMSPRDRADLIKRSGSDASIWAARRDYLPSDNGAVEEWLR